MLLVAGMWDQFHWVQLVAGGCQVSAMHHVHHVEVSQCELLSQTLEEPMDLPLAPTGNHCHPGVTLAWG